MTSTWADLADSWSEVGDTWWGIFDVGPWHVAIDVDGTYVDVSSRVESISTSRGMSRLVGVARRYDQGRATIAIDNTDRVYDDVGPGTGVRITCRGQRVFTGQVSEAVANYSDHAKTSTLTLTVSDAARILNRRGIPEVDTPVGAGDTVAERIERILDEIEWSEDRRDITAGGPTLIATSWGQSAFTAINAATLADAGDAWIDPSGNVAYRPLFDSLNADAVATLSDVDGFHYSRPTKAIDDNELVNRVVYGRVEDASPSTINDVVSQDEFSDGIPATLTNNDLPHVLADDADAWAALQIMVLGRPSVRMDALTVQPEFDTELGDVVVGLDLLDRIDILFTPPGGGDPIELSVWITEINHRAQGLDWEVSFKFVSGGRFRFLTYDDAQDGKLDLNGFGPTAATFTGGRYEVTADEVAVAGDWSVLQSQMVMRFDTYAAAVTALGEPDAGTVIWTPDTGVVVWTGSAWRQVGGT